MRKIAVIYTTRYGTTRTYAEWIAQPVAADLFPARGKREDLEPYDTIVFGGYRRGLQIAGIDYLKKNFDALNGKRVIIFCVGLGPANRQIMERVLAANFTSAMRKQISMFGLRGAMNIRRLRGKDRFKMSLMRMRLKMKRADHMTEEEVALLEATEHPVNFTDENTVKPIVKAILGIGQPVSYLTTPVEDKTAEIKMPPPKRERTPSRPTPVEAKPKPEKREKQPKKPSRKKTLVAKKKKPAPKAAVKKRPAKKAAGKKRPVKKAAGKKKAAARKKPAKKKAVSRKKTVAKRKQPVKKAASKKNKTMGKKTSAQRSAPRKRPVKKAASKKKPAGKKKSAKKKTVKKGAARRSRTRLRL